MHSFIKYLNILVLLLNLKQYEAKYADECMTPDYTPGQCVPIFSCSDMINTLFRDGKNTTTNFKNYIRQSMCGRFNNVQHVCCVKENIALNLQGLEVLNKTECGHFQEEKIYGNGTRLFEFPWMALLRYNDDNELLKCAGTLISHRYVLTAAHCKTRHGPTEVRLGEFDIRSDPDCQQFFKEIFCAPSVEDVGIEEIIVHPDYVNNEHNNIALLRLNRNVNFGPHIRAVCLPISEELRTEFPKKYSVSGWGTTKRTTSSNVLKFAVIPHKDLDVCSNIFKHFNLTNYICAGGENMEESCYGDYGGPLTAVNLYNGNLRIIQYGVISLSVRLCGDINIPGVYTNVVKYMQWITDTIRDD